MEENKWCVYKHTNKNNGKVYVGITSLKPEKRWNKGNGYKRCSLFYRAIQKYNWDGFKHEILFENLSEQDAINKEIELIEKYQSNNCNFGYNLASGGEGTTGVTPSENTLEKMRLNNTGENNPMFGKHHTGEARKIMSELKKGKKLSPEHREKLSEVRKGENNGNAKAVYCLELNKTFEYIELAAKELGVMGTHISACCKGKRKTTGGYHFTYARCHKKTLPPTR